MNGTHERNLLETQSYFGFVQLVSCSLFFAFRSRSLAVFLYVIRVYSTLSYPLLGILAPSAFCECDIRETVCSNADMRMRDIRLETEHKPTNP